LVQGVPGDGDQRPDHERDRAHHCRGHERVPGRGIPSPPRGPAGAPVRVGRSGGGHQPCSRDSMSAHTAGATVAASASAVHSGSRALRTAVSSWAKLACAGFVVAPVIESTTVDRKSTRLNSSHVSISYAVFCLKKKKK